jgi:3-hydroxyacyl-CoA dehydrogenase
MIHSSLIDGVCVLRLEAPPLNTINFALLHQLEELVGRAMADPQVRGVVIAGRPDHLSAGADLHLFEEIQSAEDAVRVSRVFQAAFQVLEDCPKPVGVALAGRVIGAALEMASACHVRVATPTTRFSMPEVTLGINPGAGGTQRLPRLMGVGPALGMLVDAQTVDAARALSWGLIDQIASETELVEAVCCRVAAQATPRRTRHRTGKIGDREVNAAAFEEARARIAKGRPEIIAPRLILDAVRTGVEESFTAGLEFEQAAFAECMATPAARAKIYVFFARRQTGKQPAGVEAVPVRQAAVVGMGTMGTGIAQALVTSGIPAMVRDEEQRFLDRGRQRIQSSLDKRVEQGKLAANRAAEILDRLTTTTRWEDLAGAELIIEAVPEELALKRSVLGRLAQVAPGAMLATNTSTLSLDDLAVGLPHPERLLGLHFFNPAHHMPLVEVIHREATAAELVATGLGLVRALGKTPVLVRNREGFVVNRVFVPYLQEAFALVEEGADPATVDQALVEFGMPMGPLAVSDLAGLDVLLWAQQVLARAFPRHGPLSPIVERLVQRGDRGQKTGAGLYRYEKGDPTPRPSAAADEIVAAVRAGRCESLAEKPYQSFSPLTPGPSPARGEGSNETACKEEITQRLVLRMVSEAFYLIEERVVQRESDIDVAMILGTGFPEFRGGPIHYARTLGVDRVVAELNTLAARLGPRFAPSPATIETPRS